VGVTAGSREVQGRKPLKRDNNDDDDDDDNNNNNNNNNKAKFPVHAMKMYGGTEV
jgi:hypothetical protein